MMLPSQLESRLGSLRRDRSVPHCPETMQGRSIWRKRLSNTVEKYYRHDKARIREQLDIFMGLRGEISLPVRIIVYCRVSSKAQKPDLENQKRVLEGFCAARGLANIV